MFKQYACSGLLCSLWCVLAMPAHADQGISLSIESLFAPLGKQVQQYPESARQANGTSSTPAASPVVDTSQPLRTVPGRETTEWLGVSGFVDINRNWRFLYGAHTTLLEQMLFKFDGAFAFMLEPLDKIPVQTYFLLGATPVLSPDPALPAFSLTYQTGVGVNYTWNNTLYTDIRLNWYMASLVSQDQNRTLGLNWNLGTFSLGLSTGLLF